MKEYGASFSSGVLFGAGLVISGMTRPAKVVGFLDFFGDWDPSLLFVMGGAVVAYALVNPLVLRRGRPLWADHFRLPRAKRVDSPLIVGATLFGVGWGLAGFCPGPSLTAVGAGTPAALVFVAAMLAGMVLYRVLHPARAAISPAKLEPPTAS